jgi:transcriptional regulator with PAS, ATPase and Fis domain
MIIGRKQARLGRHIERVPDRLMREFRAYAWPGNIRELSFGRAIGPIMRLGLHDGYSSWPRAG